MRNVLKNNPRITRERLERTRGLMDDAVRDCLVTEYADLIDSLILPDPDDRHVLAAAIRSGSELIVTYNLTDFPIDVLSAHDIEALHPDDLITQVIESDPDEACVALKQQRESLKNPPLSVNDLLVMFEKQYLAQTVNRLRSFSDRI